MVEARLPCDHDAAARLAGRAQDEHALARARGEQLYADRMRFIRRVDQLGYDGIIFTEHHYGEPGAESHRAPAALCLVQQEVIVLEVVLVAPVQHIVGVGCPVPAGHVDRERGGRGSPKGLDLVGHHERRFGFVSSQSAGGIQQRETPRA